MSESSKDRAANEAVVRIDGVCTIEQAATLKPLLLEGLEQTDDVRVDVSRVTDTDLSFLQLLCAAHKQALITGKRFTVEGGLADVIVRRAREAGLTRHRGCTSDVNKECLWVGV